MSEPTTDPTTDPTPEPDPTPDPDPEPEAEAEAETTFPRQYVEDLRRESAGYRDRAKVADTLRGLLATAHATADGRLADPTDLPYDEALLDDDGLPDPGKVTAAVDDLLARKPHLASRKPRGDVGQGATGGTGGVDLAALLRAGAS